MTPDSTRPPSAVRSPNSTATTTITLAPEDADRHWPADREPRFQVGDMVTAAKDKHLWKQRVVERQDGPGGVFAYQLTGRHFGWHFEDELKAVAS